MNAVVCSQMCQITPKKNLNSLSPIHKLILSASLDSKTKISQAAAESVAEAQKATGDSYNKVTDATKISEENDETADLLNKEADKAAAKSATSTEVAEEMRKLSDEAAESFEALKDRGMFTRFSRNIQAFDFWASSNDDENGEEVANAQSDMADDSVHKANQDLNAKDKAWQDAAKMQMQADAAKIDMETAKQILNVNLANTVESKVIAEKALSGMVKAKSSLLRGKFKSAVANGVNRMHEEKRIAQQADCQLKCENVLDAIDGTGIYKAAVLHAIVEVNLK